MFDPTTYLQVMADEVPAFEELQDEVVKATRARRARRILELGIGSGETARRLLPVHPGADLVAIDSGRAMLEHARQLFPTADLRLSRLEDPLPEGPFDLAVSVLAIHHLDGPAKRDLFGRIAGCLATTGLFVMGDLVVPDDPAEVVTPIDGVYDTPSSANDMLGWLSDAGFEATISWRRKDLAVFSASWG